MDNGDNCPDNRENTSIPPIWRTNEVQTSFKKQKKTKTKQKEEIRKPQKENKTDCFLWGGNADPRMLNPQSEKG